MSRLTAAETARRRQLVLDAHTDGATPQAIADALGISVRTVHRYIEEARIPKAQASTRADVLAAYLKGEKVEAIAVSFGVTTRTVFRYAAEAKVQRGGGKPGRIGTWPDCPPHLRTEYRRLSWRHGTREARRILETARG